MAKQRGIHQIAGKINDLVYYGQKYVDTGLIRKQNAAMSGRVKSDPEFANTRKSALEFGYCSQLAAQIINQLPARTSNIVNPFILPKFTRYLYAFLKNQSGSVGSRKFPMNEDFARYVSIFVNKICKNRWDGDMPPVNFPTISGVVNQNALFTFSVTLDRLAVANYCDTYGFDGIRFTFYDEGGMTIGKPDSVTGTFTRSFCYSYALRQRITIMKDEHLDISQMMQCTMYYPYVNVLILAEPIIIRNGQSTYPKNKRSYIFGCVSKET